MPSWGEHPPLVPPLDFSFLPAPAPRPPGPPRPCASTTTAWGGWGGLPPALERLLVLPTQLRWLDLSFNRLTTIDPVLTTLRALQSLQLHGNGIGSLAEVDKLGVLLRLRRLTLHGNPMEEQRGYRSYVLSLLPHLTSLDFTGVTGQDRQDAATARAQRGKKKGGAPGRGTGCQAPAPR
ncbi:leucine-rich repeat-containing protein 51 [Balearica regulorum gibbericeps]|uniref:leucine-rich repeat-containing protein 51 n=1 Tax=Balearica regulorum gibbericeps TaxID=100784 RepID=UPI003F63C169